MLLHILQFYLSIVNLGNIQAFKDDLDWTLKDIGKIWLELELLEFEVILLFYYLVQELHKIRWHCSEWLKWQWVYLASCLFV